MNYEAKRGDYVEIAVIDSSPELKGSKGYLIHIDVLDVFKPYLVLFENPQLGRGLWWCEKVEVIRKDAFQDNFKVGDIAITMHNDERDCFKKGEPVVIVDIDENDKLGRYTVRTQNEREIYIHLLGTSIEYINLDEEDDFQLPSLPQALI